MFSKKTFFLKWAAAPSILLLAACSSEDLLNAEQAITAGGEVSGSASATVTATANGAASTSGNIQNVSTCTMVSVNNAVNVICDGVLVGVVGNSGQTSTGSAGQATQTPASSTVPVVGGSSGELVGCSMVELADNLGYSVTCGNKTGVILNGRDGTDGVDGKDGKDGASCTTTPIPDGSGVYVICGESVVAVYNGKDGTNGVNGTDGVDGRDGVDGKDGVDGRDGVDGKDGIDGKDGRDGVNGLNGTDGRDGADGANGKDGADGRDGTDCRIVSSTDSTLSISCGADTSTIKATVYNSYSGGTQTGTTFEPVIVYVSSSSRAAYSSAAQVSVSPQPAYNYTVEPGVVNGKCGAYSPGCIGCNQTIYHGDSVKFQFDANETASITDVLNSVYEWKFPGATTASYAARGNDGIVTANVFYDSIGTFYPKLSINGATLTTYGSERCSGYVEVKASLIKNCACTEDTENSTETHRAWKLSGCQSYAPITSYTWAGVESSSADGLSALAPYDYDGQTRVTLKNADNTVKEVACGYILDNSTGYTFSKPGTYYLTYMCSKAGYSTSAFHAETRDADAMWVTSKTSAEVNYSTNGTYDYGYSYYNRLFNASSNENASGSAIAFILRSGTFKVHCGW